MGKIRNESDTNKDNVRAITQEAVDAQQSKQPVLQNSKQEQNRQHLRRNIYLVPTPFPSW